MRTIFACPVCEAWQLEYDNTFFADPDNGTHYAGAYLAALAEIETVLMEHWEQCEPVAWNFVEVER